MNVEEIKEYIADFQKRKLPELTKRELKIGSSRRIKSIVAGL